MPISTMKQLTVLSMRSDADAIVRRLMNLRCVEIRSTEVGDGALLSAHFDSDGQKTAADSRLRKIREALPILHQYDARRKGLGGRRHRVDFDVFALDARYGEALDTVEKTLALRDRIEALKTEQARLESRMTALTPWLEYDAVLGMDGTKDASVMLGSYAAGTEIEMALEELTQAGAYAELVSNEKETTYVSVICHRSDEAEINRLLASRGFVRIVFRDVQTTAAVAYDEAQAQASLLATEQLAMEERLRELAEHLDGVEILCDFEATNLHAARHLSKLATTDQCAILEGWIPEFTVETVKKVLDHFACAYELRDPLEEEEPPVLLRNNRFAMNFEWVIGMYAYPKYGAFDPTFWMSIFYFLLFGLMFADVGYGLILVLGSLFAVKFLNLREGMKRMIAMFGYCGVGSILMGMIFGGWFGDLPVAIMTNLLGISANSTAGHFFGSGLWFNPLDDPMTFLILSLGIGFAHLITGMIINFVVLCKRGRTAEAVCTILPYWVFFLGLILMLLGMVGSMPAVLSDIGTVVLIIGALMILFLNGYGRKNVFSRIIGGFGGLYGLINYASDLLSYSRVLALGLVAGVIAKVINLITMVGATGPVGLVFMIVILLVGHGLNLAINVLGTFVHTSRLQYIEFFGKFYEDGGKPFEPATAADQYTETI